MNIGYWGIPGSVVRGKVHIESNGKPFCGWRPSKKHRFQWCSIGVRWDWVECDSCIKYAKLHGHDQDYSPAPVKKIIEVDKNIMTRQKVQKILDRIKYYDWEFYLGQDGSRLYLQIKFNSEDSRTNLLEKQRGRRWLLSPNMTKSEIVSTAFKAVITAVEHETREMFLYRGKSIFNPHMDVEYLVNSMKTDKRKKK